MSVRTIAMCAGVSAIGLIAIDVGLARGQVPVTSPTATTGAIPTQTVFARADTPVPEFRTFQFRNATPKQVTKALTDAFQPGDIRFVVQPNSVVVAAVPAQMEHVAKVIDKLERGAFDAPAPEFRTFPFRNATPKQVTQALTDVFRPGDIRFVVQPTANSVVVVATPTRMEQVVKVLDKLERAAAAKPPAPAFVRAEPKALPQGPNKILFYRAGDLVLIDPDGKNEKKLAERDERHLVTGGQLSPDGKMLAWLVWDSARAKLPANAGKHIRPTLHVRTLDEKGLGTDLKIECQVFAWSPDGTQIVCSDFVDGPELRSTMTSHVIDVKTKKAESLKLPDDHVVTDWSKDGKYFLTTQRTSADPPAARLYLMNRDGTEHKALTKTDKEPYAMMGKFSPDGTRVLYLSVTPPAKPGARPAMRLSILDVATGKSAPVADTPLNGDVESFCWSPDGKQIAYTWRVRHEGKPEDLMNKETESFLVVCDPDGKNQKTVVTEKAQGQAVITIGHVSWR